MPSTGPFIMLTPIMTAERREEGMKIWKEGRSRRRGMKILREVIINSLWIVMYVYASHLACVWTRPFFFRNIRHISSLSWLYWMLSRCLFDCVISECVSGYRQPLLIFLSSLWLCNAKTDFHKEGSLLPQRLWSDPPHLLWWITESDGSEW